MKRGFTALMLSALLLAALGYGKIEANVDAAGSNQPQDTAR